MDDKLKRITLIVIAFTVVLSIIGGMASTIKDSAQAAATPPNNCSTGTDSAGVALSYNYTNGFCKNSTGDKLYAASTTPMPLQALFNESGIAVLVLMAALLIGVIAYLLHKVRQR